MHDSWKAVLLEEFHKPYFTSLRAFVASERKSFRVYPDPEDTFNAFRYTAFDKTSVLILGQDPYPGAGQAHGLSFSVRPGVSVPPSLKNIFKEVESDLGHLVPKHGHLVSWAEQGVMLLNSTLTVRAGEVGSHQGYGWERFTDQVIRLLSGREQPVVFILWGTMSRQKRDIIDSSRHLVLEAAHPSPRSAHTGFFGSRPFSKANEALGRWGLPEVRWQLPLGV